jgi:hypothetical protein
VLESKIREEEDLKKGLKALDERIRPMPGPDIPQFVWDDMGDRTEWPLLDAVTASALEEYCDNDLFPKEMLFTLGEYLSSSLSTEEIKLWIPIVSEDSLESYRIPLCRPRAELVGYLTNVFTELSMIWANDFRHQSESTETSANDHPCVEEEELQTVWFALEEEQECRGLLKGCLHVTKGEREYWRYASNGIFRVVVFVACAWVGTFPLEVLRDEIIVHIRIVLLHICVNSAAHWFPKCGDILRSFISSGSRVQVSPTL